MSEEEVVVKLTPDEAAALGMLATMVEGVSVPSRPDLADLTESASDKLAAALGFPPESS